MTAGSDDGSGGLEAHLRLLVEQRLRTALHEIRQPLAAVLALAEAAATVPDVPPAVRGYLDRIVEQALEVSGAAGSVLGPRDGDSSTTEPADVGEVLDSVLQGFALTWRGRVRRRGDDAGLQTPVPRVVLRRCLVNVLDNATRAAGDSGCVVVTVRRVGDTVRIVVEDDGPGFGRIPAGAGLGLALTRMALEAVGGSLSTGLPSGTGGARVALCLPVLVPGTDSPEARSAVG